MNKKEIIKKQPGSECKNTQVQTKCEVLKGEQREMSKRQAGLSSEGCLEEAHFT